jgi:hypothetical protein
MPYHIDYSLVPIAKYREKILSTDLVPSRKLLKRNIKEVFNCFMDLGIINTAQLLHHLKHKDRLAELALESGIDENYLTILGRELRSSLPRPERWLDFKDINYKIKETLLESGIKNTKHFWEKSLTPKMRIKLSEKTGLDMIIIEKLARLSDLCRVRWVNHTFAEILWKAGVRSVAELCNQDFEQLHTTVVELNSIYKWYNAHIGKNDFKLIISAARDLSIEMQF